MQIAGVVEFLAEARHGAALSEHRDVWQAEAMQARLGEAQAFTRAQVRLEVLAEREVARVQGQAAAFEHTAAFQR